jgi:hypothetical protein
LNAKGADGGHAKHHECTQLEADSSLSTAIEAQLDLAPPVA